MSPGNTTSWCLNVFDCVFCLGRPYMSFSAAYKIKSNQTEISFFSAATDQTCLMINPGFCVAKKLFFYVFFFTSAKGRSGSFTSCTVRNRCELWTNDMQKNPCKVKIQHGAPLIIDRLLTELARSDPSWRLPLAGSGGGLCGVHVWALCNSRTHSLCMCIDVLWQVNQWGGDAAARLFVGLLC